MSPGSPDPGSGGPSAFVGKLAFNSHKFAARLAPIFRVHVVDSWGQASRLDPISAPRGDGGCSPFAVRCQRPNWSGKTPIPLLSMMVAMCAAWSVMGRTLLKWALLAFSNTGLIINVPRELFSPAALAP